MTAEKKSFLIEGTMTASVEVACFLRLLAIEFG
jgi:hypothetical protein